MFSHLMNSNKIRSEDNKTADLENSEEPRIIKSRPCLVSTKERDRGDFGGRSVLGRV